MRILILHNHYGDYAFGGEAMVMQAEARLLRNHGHDVRVYERTNTEITSRNLWGKIQAFRNMTWSREGYDAVVKEIDVFKPDVMHVHNYWLVLTPSVFAAAKNCGVKTIFTLHNYRLICPGNQLLRNNKPCELCLNGHAYRVLWSRCYPGKSLLKSILSFILYNSTRKRNYLAHWIDAYIALTEFGRMKFIEGGLPAEKIHVKPNFTDDPLDSQDILPNFDGAIYVGRISPEKGLMTLIKAWQDINYPLTVIGDGPQMQSLKRIAPANVIFKGQQPHGEALQLIANSSFLVFPSECYEGFPLAPLEAVAFGKPVVATDQSPRCETVHDNVTGLLFKTGDTKDLRQKVLKLINNPGLCASMGKAGRQLFLKKYSPEKNYSMLMDIYRTALSRSKGEIS